MRRVAPPNSFSIRCAMGILFALVVALAPLFAGRSATAASLDLIGTYPEYGGPDRIMLSADGRTVVGVDRPFMPFDPRRAFLWTRAEGLRFTDELGPGSPEPTEFVPSAISGDGSRVVGELGGEAILWRVGEGIEVLAPLPGGTTDSRATGISDDGRFIVGSAHTGATAIRMRPFPGGGFVEVEVPYRVPARWTVERREVVGLGELEGTAWDVSNQGVVVGEERLDSPIRFPEVGFRWDESRGLQRVPTWLDDVFPPWNPDATVISADGNTLAGRSFDWVSWPGGPPVAELGYLWSGDTGVGDTLPRTGLELLRPPLADGDDPTIIYYSKLTGLSADGSVAVGYYESSTHSASLKRPFIWSKDRGFEDLEVLLEAMGIDTTGWLLDVAVDVSADGKTILGLGRYDGPLVRDAVPAGWIVVIPEPTTTLLIGLGLIGLAGPGRSGNAKAATRSSRLGPCEIDQQIGELPWPRDERAVAGIEDHDRVHLGVARLLPLIRGRERFVPLEQDVDGGDARRTGRLRHDLRHGARRLGPQPVEEPAAGLGVEVAAEHGRCVRTSRDRRERMSHQVGNRLAGRRIRRR